VAASGPPEGSTLRPVDEDFLQTIVEVGWSTAGSGVVGGMRASNGDCARVFLPDDSIIGGPAVGALAVLRVGFSGDPGLPYPPDQQANYWMNAFDCCQLSNKKFAVGFTTFGKVLGGDAAPFVWGPYGTFDNEQIHHSFRPQPSGLLQVYNADGSLAWSALPPLGPDFFKGAGVVSVAACRGGDLAVAFSTIKANSTTGGVALPATVRRYSSNGAVKWSRPLTVSGADSMLIRGLSVTGTKDGGLAVAYPASTTSVAVRKYSSKGVLLWAQTLAPIVGYQNLSPVCSRAATGDFFVVTVQVDRVVAIDANTGEILWEKMFDVNVGDFVIGADVGADNQVFILVDNFVDVVTNTRIIRVDGLTGATVWSKPVLTSGPLPRDGSSFWSTNNVGFSGGGTGLQIVAPQGEVIIGYNNGTQHEAIITGGTSRFYETYEVRVRAFNQSDGSPAWTEPWSSDWTPAGVIDTGFLDTSTGSIDDFWKVFPNSEGISCLGRGVG